MSTGPNGFVEVDKGALAAACSKAIDAEPERLRLEWEGHVQWATKEYGISADEAVGKLKAAGIYDRVSVNVMALFRELQNAALAGTVGDTMYISTEAAALLRKYL